MTEQEINEGNKLIAEFMGYEYFPLDKSDPENKPLQLFRLANTCSVKNPE